jgi:peptidyl-prolyl cis-trans isomerase B (cyclophilin B)
MASAPGIEIAPDAAFDVTISTDRGDIVMRLDAALAPTTVNHFVVNARNGFYDGLIFHRVVPDFVIQGGDPDGNGRGGPGYRFADEPVQGEYTLGAVAMANAGPDTNGSQFFIVYRDSPLPPSYTVFGEVDAAGLAVVRSIAKAGSDDSNGAGDGAPLQEVVIASVK